MKKHKKINKVQKRKTSKQIERHVKGIANHHRINILLLIAKNEGITLEQIVENLEANEKTIGEHARRLYQAGLIKKKYHGKIVEHSLSPYGVLFVKFLGNFASL